MSRYKGFLKMLSSGILTLLLQYGADPDITHDSDDFPSTDPDDNSSESTAPAWLSIPEQFVDYEDDMKDLKTQALFAMALLEAACRKRGSYPMEEDRFESPRVAGPSYLMDLERKALSDWPNYRSADEIRSGHIATLNKIFARKSADRSTYEFQVAVKARLLSIAKLRGFDTDRRWPTVEKSFEPLSPSRIKSWAVTEKNSTEPLGTVADSQSLKRKRESQSADEEALPKRHM